VQKSHKGSSFCFTDERGRLLRMENITKLISAIAEVAIIITTIILSDNSNKRRKK
jgi:hypothetical protein